MKRGPRVLLASSMALAVVVSAAAARAQTSDEAGALSLFEDAKKLVDEGKYAEACPKLATSYKLAQRLGTLLNLADCYEKSGQTASAWARFTEAATMAERAGQPERMEFAKDHAAALAPKLSRLTVRVASPVVGLQVTRDGVPVDAPMFGEAVAVDPGSHVVDATAPGRKPWRGSIELARDGALATIEIPTLEEAPTQFAAAQPPAPQPSAPEEDALANARAKARLRVLGGIGGGIGWRQNVIDAPGGSCGGTIYTRADLVPTGAAQIGLRQRLGSSWWDLSVVSTFGFLSGGNAADCADSQGATASGPTSYALLDATLRWRPGYLFFGIGPSVGVQVTTLSGSVTRAGQPEVPLSVSVTSLLFGPVMELGAVFGDADQWEIALHIGPVAMDWEPSPGGSGKTPGGFKTFLAVQRLSIGYAFR